MSGPPARVPSHIGSKTAEIRQPDRDPARRRPPPGGIGYKTMFLAND